MRPGPTSPRGREEDDQLRAFARRLRTHSLRMISSAKTSHIGSCLSLADILAVLYGSVLRVDPEDAAVEDGQDVGQGQARADVGGLGRADHPQRVRTQPASKSAQLIVFLPTMWGGRPGLPTTWGGRPWAHRAHGREGTWIFRRRHSGNSRKSDVRVELQPLQMQLAHSDGIDERVRLAWPQRIVQLIEGDDLTLRHPRHEILQRHLGRL